MKLRDCLTWCIEFVIIAFSYGDKTHSVKTDSYTNISATIHMFVFQFHIYILVSPHTLPQLGF